MMVDTAYFVKSILPRALIGSFKHFVDIYFSKSVCISACRGYQVSCTLVHLNSMFQFLVACTAKLDLRSHARILYDWEGNEISSLAESECTYGLCSENLFL